MAFTSIGSDEEIFQGVTSASDTISVAVPDLAAESIGVVIVHHMQAAQTVSGVTWNGDAMTPAVSVLNGNTKVYIFYLANPDDNATLDIVASYSANSIHTAVIVPIWASASGAVTLDDTSSATATSQTLAITSTQAGANELVISGASSLCNDLASPPTDVTDLQSEDLGGVTVSSGYSIPSGSGDATHTHSFAATTEAGAVASASFKEAAGGGATFSRRSLTLLGAGI